MSYAESIRRFIGAFIIVTREALASKGRCLQEAAKQGRKVSEIDSIKTVFERIDEFQGDMLIDYNYWTEIVKKENRDRLPS